MKTVCLILVFSIFLVNGVKSQSVLLQKSGVKLSATVSYYNTIEKYDCKFDQYLITGYVENYSGRRIYWNWGSISYDYSGYLYCNNSLYNPSRIEIDRGKTSASFSSFLYMDHGDMIKTSFYMLMYDGEKPGYPGCNWNWEFRD